MSEKSVHVFSESYQQNKEEFLDTLEQRGKRGFIVEKIFHRQKSFEIGEN